MCLLMHGAFFLMPKERIQWIDFCRVYTAFMVVLRHVDRWFDSAGPSVNYVVDLFNYRSLIFFFFLMSGYFSHKAEQGQWLAWGRTRQLLWPYMFWTLFGMCLICLPNALAGDWHWLNWQNIGGQLGLTSWCYWNYTNVPLWFLRTLLLLALICPMLQKLPTKVLLVLVLVSLAASDVLCNVDGEACESHHRQLCCNGCDSTLTYQPHEQAWLPFRTYESVLALGFFCGGLLIRRCCTMQQFTEFLTRHAWAPVAGALLLLPAVLRWGFYPPVQSAALVLLGVLTTMSIGCLCEKHLPRFCHAVAKLGPASFFIYVTHYLILDWLRYFMTGSMHGELSREFCYVAPFLIVGISLALYAVLKKICPRFMQIFALSK